jgi:hypothetical protein
MPIFLLPHQIDRARTTETTWKSLLKGLFLGGRLARAELAGEEAAPETPSLQGNLRVMTIRQYHQMGLLEVEGIFMGIIRASSNVSKRRVHRSRY